MPSASSDVGLQVLGGVALPRGLFHSEVSTQEVFYVKISSVQVQLLGASGLAGCFSTLSLVVLVLMIPLLLLEVLSPGRMCCFGGCHLADFGTSGTSRRH